VAISGIGCLQPSCVLVSAGGGGGGWARCLGGVLSPDKEILRTMTVKIILLLLACPYYSFHVAALATWPVAELT
jgi:hypothetical protein